MGKGERRMPIVQIEMFEGRTLEQKREIVQEITRALVKTANCLPKDVRIIVREIKRGNYAIAGLLSSDKQTVFKNLFYLETSCHPE